MVTPPCVTECRRTLIATTSACQNRVGKIVVGFRNRAAMLPSDRQRHDLRLAAAGGHLHTVTGEVVVLHQAQIVSRREALQYRLLRAVLPDREEVYQRPGGFLLPGMIRELTTIGQSAVGMEPVIEKNASCVADALVSGLYTARW